MRRILFAALCAAIVGGCGGSRAPSSSPSQPPPLRTIQGHPCTPTDEALQCVLPPAPQRLQLRASPFSLPGIDCAWGCPLASQVPHYRGARFVAGYLSHDRSKNWTQGRVLEYLKAHIGVVKVFESSAARAGQGCTAGRTDAFYAAREAAELYDTTRPISLAIDFDATGEQVAPYFRCARQVLGGRTMAYGSYYVVMWLHAHGLVGNQNWCTYAWSRGHTCPASVGPLQQYQNDDLVDYDRAIAPDFGQWPGPEVAKPASHHDLEARIRTLHRVLQTFGCRRRVAQHEPTGPRCKRWKREGDQAHRLLGR